jgi:hypothetical protein
MSLKDLLANNVLSLTSRAKALHNIEDYVLPHFRTSNPATQERYRESKNTWT